MKLDTQSIASSSISSLPLPKSFVLRKIVDQLSTCFPKPSLQRTDEHSSYKNFELCSWRHQRCKVTMFRAMSADSTTRTPTTRFPDPYIPAPGALKMEPELSDFMALGSNSYTWGATPTQLFNNNNDNNSLTCFGTPQQQLPDIATQFGTQGAQIGTQGAQIQALRDFMVYGGAMVTPSPPNLGFYFDNGGGGIPSCIPSIIPSCIPSCIPSIPPSVAYRALCSEIYNNATTERSPHRSQFQRENHILAERQRREEMNEKFSALRAMIPKATKKDKASIVGDTIDYVLELEKRLKQLQACKDTGIQVGKGLKRKLPWCEDGGGGGGGGSSSETTTMNVREVGIAKVVGVSGESPVREVHSVASSPSEQVTAESVPSGKMKEAAAAEVDVQQLGKQAVVKVVCNPRPGHVLRVLNALEECKVEVLQSNVMTVADNSIHFVTVQLEEGVSTPTEELISAVLQAIDP